MFFFFSLLFDNKFQCIYSLDPLAVDVYDFRWKTGLGIGEKGRGLKNWMRVGEMPE